MSGPGDLGLEGHESPPDARYNLSSSAPGSHQGLRPAPMSSLINPVEVEHMDEKSSNDDPWISLSWPQPLYFPGSTNPFGDIGPYGVGDHCDCGEVDHSYQEGQVLYVHCGCRDCRMLLYWARRGSTQLGTIRGRTRRNERLTQTSPWTTLCPLVAAVHTSPPMSG
jgi:hypothetical protein